MSPLGGPWDTGMASTPLHAHACNCVGCCPKCGTCRTWHGHTPDYCALLVKQANERALYLGLEGKKLGNKGS